MYIQEIFLDLETFFISLICLVDFCFLVAIDLDTLFVSRLVICKLLYTKCRTLKNIKIKKDKLKA